MTQPLMQLLIKFFASTKPGRLHHIVNSNRPTCMQMGAWWSQELVAPDGIPSA